MTEVMMFPTRTTSTTGTLRVPPTARSAQPQPAAVAPAGPDRDAPHPHPAAAAAAASASAAAEPEPARAAMAAAGAVAEQTAAPQAGSGRGTPAGPASHPAPEGPRSHPAWAAPEPASALAAVSAPRAERALPDSATAAHGGPAPVARTASEGPRSHPGWATELRPASEGQVRAERPAEPEPGPGPDPRTPSAPLSPAAPEGLRSHPAWATAEPAPLRAAAPALATPSRPAWTAAEPEPVPGPDLAQVAVAHGPAVAVAVPRPDTGAAAEAPREHPVWEAEALALASASSGPAAAAAVGAPREEAGAGAPAETSVDWAAAPSARSARADEPVSAYGPEVPAARTQSESESEPAAAEGPEIPHPQDAQDQTAGVATLSLRTIEPASDSESGPDAEPGPESGSEPVAASRGVPGPGAAEIVAQAVSRGLGKPPVEGDAEDVPRSVRQRGTSVTEVPVHLPFRGDPKPMPAPAPRPDRSRTTPRPAPGRRVPRGDDRLREHRGPVLPGWVGVAVGGLALAGCTAVLWRAGVVPAPFVAAFGATPRAYHGLRVTHWPPLAFLGVVALVALGGLGRARTGHAWVLTLFGRYRGTVRRTGLTWVSPLLLRRRVDVRLRHWRSDPMPAVDSGGLALQVVVQVVWQVKDTARAALAVEDHTEYLAEQVESAMARVLSQLPADAFHEDAPTLRDAEAVGDALTRMLAAETEAVGIEVFSAQPTRIEYAAEVAEAMRRRRVAAIDAKHRDTVLTSVVDAVDDTVHRLTSRGLVELDDYERKALVRDLTVAFYTGRPE
ncbi:SPFH domain-containing protein [Streptomyces sp. NPDC005533]|uniref:SPFH domain-containing protein n=1 Tax=Streptomyces sp. NPDC005533 TaxID=3364723 RepID=UPI003685CC21